MKKVVLLKRVLFWLESSASMVIVLVAGAILTWVLIAGLLSDDMLAWLREIGGVFAYFIDPAIKIFLTEPLVVVSTLFWVSVYIGTTIYFAQTDSEKRKGKYLIPLTFSRELPFDIAEFGLIERPVMEKADARNPTFGKFLADGRYTPQSCRWAKLGLKGC